MENEEKDPVSLGPGTGPGITHCQSESFEKKTAPIVPPPPIVPPSPITKLKLSHTMPVRKCSGK